MTEPIRIPPLAAAGPDPARQVKMLKLAQDLEASFLAEMLGHAGLGDAEGSFGGGIGAEQFGSFLRREQAAAMTRAGGIGLAEHLFRAMARADHV